MLLLSDFERPAAQEAGPMEQPSTSGTPRPTVYELIWHASDSSVKPIVANRRIERLPEPKWDAQALPFRPLVGALHCLYMAQLPAKKLCWTKADVLHCNLAPHLLEEPQAHAE